MQKYFGFGLVAPLFLFSILASSTHLLADPVISESLGNTVTAENTSPAVSPSPSLALPEVVITANRLQTPVSQVANSMTVLTAQDIEQRQARTALDALQGVPGLTLSQNGAPGENSGIFIRGADAGHTLVLMDGVPLNNPISTDRGFSNWDQFFTDDISQIEVIRGPMSTLYGTNATAGVVNILTQKGKGGPKGSFLFEGGAFSSFREAATASAGNDFGNIALSLSRFDTQGFPSADKSFGNTVNNRDGNSTASLQAGISAVPNLDSHLIARFSSSRTNVDAAGGVFGDDPNYFLDEQQWMAGSQSKLSLLNGDWEQTLGFSITDDLQKFTDDFSSYPNSHYERGVFEGQGAQINWQNNIHAVQGETLVVGLQGQQEWGKMDDTTDYGYGPSETLIDKTMTTGSLFLESQTSILDRVFATIGVRLDGYSSFGDQFTYRGALAYFIPVLETKLKATYGTGFKVPSLYQLYSPYGDANLSAESSLGWDAGFEQPFLDNRVTVGATYFHTDFTNLIDFDNNTFLYNNISRARTEGWETFASAHPLKHLECRADYTYTWAVNLVTGDPLIRRPQSRADFSAFYQWGDANIGFNTVYVGDRPDMAFINFTSTPVNLASYVLVNLMGSYQLDKGIKLFGRINNLFNTSYEEVYGYGTPGLSAYLGTKISL